MDVLSMQAVNRVLRRMNTEFNGLYDVAIATEGQTIFQTSKIFTEEALHVYVDGWHSIKGTDFVRIDDTHFEFAKPLKLGTIVLATTEVVGVPKFEVPGYDDTVITEEIASLAAQIANIIAALDEDGDGSIVDTIADIKSQWETADGNLQTLILDLATKIYVDEQLALKANVADVYTKSESDGAMLNKASATDLQVVEQNILDLQSKTLSNFTIIGDDAKTYKLTVVAGVLTAEEVI